MKTSKKLLSLFLSLVMIITSCSVGFTAFAADSNKTDTNNTYWKDDTTAQGAFETVEFLLNALVQGPLKGTLEENNIVNPVTQATTLSDVVYGASPVLLKVLMGLGTLDLSIIDGPTIELQMSKEQFLKMKLGSDEYVSKKAYYDRWYAPLDGDEDDLISFYGLYGLCMQHKDDGGKLGEYCTEKLALLDALYESIPAPVEKPVEKAESEIAMEKAQAWLDQVASEASVGANYALPVLEDYENATYSGKTLAEYSAEEIAATDGKYLLDYYNKALTGIGMGEITNLAQLLYYARGDYSKYNVIYNLYFDLIKEGGASVDPSPLGVEGSTAKEVSDNFHGATDYWNEIYTYGIVPGLNLSTYDDSVDGPPFEEYFEAYTLNQLFFMLPHGKDISDIDAMGDILSGYYKEMTKGMAKKAGLDLNGIELTDAQWSAIAGCGAADAAALRDFVNKSDVSDAVKGYFNALPDAALNKLATDGAFSDSEQSTFTDMGITSAKDRINTMVYSQALIDQVMWKSKKSEYVNANITSEINVYKFYLEYIANDPGEEPENDGDPYEPYPEDGPTYEYVNYAIPSDLYLEITNIMINNLLELFKMELVQKVVNNGLSTDIDLYDTLYDVWKRLYEKPAETVFELLPAIMVLVDELLLPIVIHDDDKHNELIGLVEGILLPVLLNNYTQTAGSDVGAGQFHIDLNRSLPAILHWATGDQQGAMQMIGGEHYGDVYDADGNVVAHYDERILKFTNIFIVDQIVTSLDSKNLGTSIGNLIGGDMAKTLSEPWVNELIGSVAMNLRVAVDDYLDAHKNDERYFLDTSDGGQKLIVLQTGLNNVSVALPYLIDQLGRNFNDKYKVDSDWTFTYNGKIEMQSVSFEANRDALKVNELVNTHFQTFKNFGAKGSDATPADILSQFVDLLIGNWVNALLDFLNDNVMDGKIENQFIGKIPLVQGLLEALGGFGETSVITDALNGLFQIKRSHKASFTLEQRPKTNFVGFSNASAFYLISNIMYIKGGELRGLYPFIKEIIDNKSTKNNYNVKHAFYGVTPLLAASSKVSNKSAAGTDYNKLLTKENEKAAQKLVDLLDEILSSLLSNTSVNGFDIDSTENLLTGVTTVLAAYFGSKNTNDLLKLINNYLFYVTGESQKTPSKRGKIGNKPTASGDVDRKKVYTSANLSNLVIQTYSLLENLVDYFFYNKSSGLLTSRDSHMLIADAVYGIISPDAVAMRLDSKYAKTIKELKKNDRLNWNSFKVEINGIDYAKQVYNTKDYLKYGFSNGDKGAFYDALGESFNGVAAILGALLATSYTDAKRSGNLYSEVINPLFTNLSTAVGAKAPMSAAAYNSAYNAKKYGSTLVDGLILPVGYILGELYDKPATYILNLIKGLGGALRDSQISRILGGLLGTVGLHVNGIATIAGYYTPTGAGALLKTIGNLQLGSIKLGDLLNGGGGLPQKNIGMTLIRMLLGNSLPFELPNADFDKLYATKTAGQTFLLIYAYLVDSVLNMDLIQTLLQSLDPSIAKMLGNIDAVQLLTVIRMVIENLKSPTEAYWSFAYYKGKIKNHYKYPNKLTAAEANEDVAKLDNLVKNVFPLLNSFGVTDITGLPQLVNDKLYTNEIITSLAKALYGAITGNDIVNAVFAALNVDCSPKGVAKFLTDRSYGKTYSSAAKTLRKAKSWDKVGKVNWGFKNKTAKAQNGFINGLAAALRPLNNVLSLLLCENDLDAGKIDLKKLVAGFNGQGGSTEIFQDKGENAGTLTYKLKGYNLVLTIQSYNITGSGHRTTKSEIIIDLKSIANDVNKLLADNLSLNFGTNGYENAIIPLLEAFMCKNVKTYKQYKRDYRRAKDNLFINILKPIGGLLNDLTAAPFDTLTKILPNVAYFIDSNGISQAVGNLLAPLLSDKGVNGVLKKNGFDIEKLITSITGKSLGKILADFIEYPGKLTLHLNNLKAFNIQDIILPLVNKLLKEKFGIKLPKFTWAQIASHGTIKVVKSAARNTSGKFTTRRVIARQGEVLFATLTYIARTLIENAKALKKLILGIDAIKKNKTLKKIIGSIFDNIAVAKPDDITGIVAYLLNGRPSDKFFDYRNFKYKDSSFSFGDLDEDFCRQLAPMLDGLIGGLLEGGLAGLAESKLYTDELVAKAATGIYGAIEGVNINDSIGSLSNLLKQTDIDLTTQGVASLLTNAKYGQAYPNAANAIRKAGSWKNVKAANLKFGVKDRDSFLHALTAVLRPLFGVLDVLLNDGMLNLFDLVEIPGSDGYTSTIVPLLEALGVYNIKTQYQYREDIFHEYDCILLDILNPLWDKVEDVLNAPLETVANMLPNLALFFANDGLTQILANLLEPISALLEALKPVANVNDLLKDAGLNVPKLLKDKVGISLPKFDLYDLEGTFKGVIGPDRVVPLLNSILPTIKIGGSPLNLELPDIDWLELASCGELIKDEPSQAACFGSRMYVKSDEDITLITVLRFLIETINYKDNYQAIVDLVSGIDGMSDTVAQVVGQVLGMLQGDTDEVIKSLVDLLQSLAG